MGEVTEEMVDAFARVWFGEAFRMDVDDARRRLAARGLEAALAAAPKPASSAEMHAALARCGLRVVTGCKIYQRDDGAWVIDGMAAAHRSGQRTG